MSLGLCLRVALGIAAFVACATAGNSSLALRTSWTFENRLGFLGYGDGSTGRPLVDRVRAIDAGRLALVPYKAPAALSTAAEEILEALPSDVESSTAGFTAAKVATVAASALGLAGLGYAAKSLVEASPAPKESESLLVRTDARIHTLEDEEQIERFQTHFSALRSVLASGVLKEVSDACSGDLRFTVALGEPVEGFYKDEDGMLVKFDLLKAVSKSTEGKTALECLRKEYTDLINKEADELFEQDVKKRYKGATVDLEALEYTITDAQGKPKTEAIEPHLIKARDYLKEKAKFTAIQEDGAKIHIIARYSSQKMQGLSFALTESLKKKRTTWKSYFLGRSKDKTESKEIEGLLNQYYAHAGSEQAQFELRKQFLEELKNLKDDDSIYDALNSAEVSRSDLGERYVDLFRVGLSAYVKERLRILIKEEQNSDTKQALTRNLNRLEKIDAETNLFKQIELQGELEKHDDFAQCRPVFMEYITNRISKTRLDEIEESIALHKDLIARKEKSKPNAVLALMEGSDARQAREGGIETFQKTLEVLTNAKTTYQHQTDSLSLLRLVPLAGEIQLLCSHDILKLGPNLDGIDKVFEKHFSEIKEEAEKIKGSRLDAYETQHLLEIFEFIARTIPASYDEALKEERLAKSQKAFASLVEKYRGARLQSLPRAEALGESPRVYQLPV